MGNASKDRENTSSREASDSVGARASFVDPSQQPFLSYLRNQAVGMQQQTAGGYGELLNVSRDLMSQSRGFLDSLTTPGEGVRATGNRVANYQPGGATANSSLLGESNIDNVINLFGEDIARQVGRQNDGAGGVSSVQALAGNRGGGRDSIERGLVGEAGVQQFASGAAGLRQQDLAQRQQLDVNQQIANLNAGVTERLGALQTDAQFGLGAEELRQKGLTGGFGGAGSIFNLGLGGLGSQFAGLEGLASLIGDPTILERMFERSQSNKQSSGNRTSDSFGVLQLGGG